MELGSDFENIKDLIEYIESNKDLKFKIEAEECWDGWYQSKNSEKSNEIIVQEIYDYNQELVGELKDEDGRQIVEFFDDYGEGYDFDKSPIQGKYYIWGKGEISRAKIIEMLDEFVEQESSDSDFYSFINYFTENCQEIDEALEMLNIQEYESGEGEEEGVNNITWNIPNYLNSFSVDLLIE